MRERYERELKIIHDEILKMGLMIERALSKAMDALRKGDSEAANTVVANDSDIDEQEALIEEYCTRTIAREQPLAGDLRNILTAIKISWELERMGDHASSLAKRSSQLRSRELTMALPDFDTMVNSILSMMHEALAAFTSHNPERARSAAAIDEVIDGLHDSFYEKSLADISSRESDPNKLVPILFLNRFLERLGDRVTNMCMWIYFAETGERVEMNKSHRL